MASLHGGHLHHDPQAQYDRANGMMMLIETGPGVISPILARAILPLIGLTGILTIDVITFFLAIGALLLVVVPQPGRSADGRSGGDTLWQEALFGFKYIFSRRSLLFLQMAALSLNLLMGLCEPVLVPMILLRTGNNSAALGSMLSIGAIGGVAGSLIMSVWGGFQRRINTVFLGWGIFAVFGLILFGAGSRLWVWAVVPVYWRHEFSPIAERVQCHLAGQSGP